MVKKFFRTLIQFCRNESPLSTPSIRFIYLSHIAVFYTFLSCYPTTTVGSCMDSILVDHTIEALKGPYTQGSKIIKAHKHWEPHGGRTAKTVLTTEVVGYYDYRPITRLVEKVWQPGSYGDYVQIPERPTDAHRRWWRKPWKSISFFDNNGREQNLDGTARLAQSVYIVGRLTEFGLGIAGTATLHRNTVIAATAFSGVLSAVELGFGVPVRKLNEATTEKEGAVAAIQIPEFCKDWRLTRRSLWLSSIIDVLGCGLYLTTAVLLSTNLTEQQEEHALDHCYLGLMIAGSVLSGYNVCRTLYSFCKS